MAKITVLSTLEKFPAHVELRKRTGSHGRHIGYSTRLECERARRNDTSAPKMRAGSHGRNLRELKRSECERARTNATFQNASGHVRTPPQKIDAPKMRAGIHKHHLGQGRQEGWIPGASTCRWIPKDAPRNATPQESMRGALKAAWNRSSNFSSNFCYAAKVIETKIMD